MNRIGKKELAGDAGKLFEQEILELNPDVPREKRCEMVEDYLFYQTDDLSKDEAKALVDRTCRTAAAKR